jgi:hypothetical protein
LARIWSKYLWLFSIRSAVRDEIENFIFDEKRRITGICVMLITAMKKRKEEKERWDGEEECLHE